jgi:hypothetical protein
MKGVILLVAFVMICSNLPAQDDFNVPVLTQEEKQQILYNHVIAYAASGISFAVTKEVSAEEYGRYVGKLFTPFWNPEDGFPAFAGGLMYILAGMHPNNEMTIISQDENSVTFKLKNVTIAFSEGPFLGVTAREFLDCSYGMIDELAKHMNVEFQHKITDDGWYVVSMKAM